MAVNCALGIILTVADRTHFNFHLFLRNHLRDTTTIEPIQNVQRLDFVLEVMNSRVNNNRELDLSLPTICLRYAF